jgi:hypothetical protein
MRGGAALRAGFRAASPMRSRRRRLERVVAFAGKIMLLGIPRRQAPSKEIG